MTPPLKPCPFCGGIAGIGKREIPPQGILWRAYCQTAFCCLGPDHEKMKDAAAAWNRRLSAPVEMSEEECAAMSYADRMEIGGAGNTYICALAHLVRRLIAGQNWGKP